ncbi:MAG: penicillin-binding protein 2 [bacterium]
MAVGQQVSMELRRLRVVLFLMMGGLFLLGGSLFSLQVERRHEFEQSLHRQSMRRVRLPATRGRIFDRNDVCLADNQPCYNLAFYLEEIRAPGRWQHTVDEVNARLKKLTGIIGRRPDISEQDIWLHIRKRLPLPLVAWRQLDPAALARLAESTMDMGGVDIYIEPVRRYPRNGLAGHLMGYVGRAEFTDDDLEGFQYYLSEMEGKAGLERVFNNVMAGAAGGRLVRINASGLKHAESRDKEPQPGEDLVLALDSRIQALAEEALRDVPGAVVVLDPSNGDVLALASSPTFNPNQFVPFLSAAMWDAQNKDPARPLVNRAVAEVYPPGSVFKPVTALAALNSGRCGPDYTHDCPGYFMIGAHPLKCWNPNGHGRVNMRKALEQSCNAYFAAVGLQCGYEAIEEMARQVGLGKKTGIDIDNEAAGLVPGQAWKKKMWKDDWRPGDTCNVSIGQGALTVTPIQMAVVAAALANGGTVYRPRLVLGLRDRGGHFTTNYSPVAVRTLAVSPSMMTTVREGMHDVVMAPTGTGARARIAGVELAGKTGTAEFGAKEERRKHGWMLLFGPFDQPRYAVAMVVDEAVSGGSTVAPRLHDMMDALFNGDGKRADG